MARHWQRWVAYMQLCPICDRVVVCERRVVFDGQIWRCEEGHIFRSGVRSGHG